VRQACAKAAAPRPQVGESVTLLLYNRSRADEAVEEMNPNLCSRHHDKTRVELRPILESNGAVLENDNDTEGPTRLGWIKS
jgi:hypothetical protein